MFNSPVDALSFVKSGKLRALATTSKQRFLELSKFYTDLGMLPATTTPEGFGQLNQRSRLVLQVSAARKALNHCAAC